MRSLAALILVPILLLGLAPGLHGRGPRRSGPVGTAREARQIAEQETGGQSLGARRIHLNGASGGWEVDIHMPGEDRGWRCIIDNDTRSVRTKTRIPNPRPKGQR